MRLCSQRRGYLTRMQTSCGEHLKQNRSKKNLYLNIVLLRKGQRSGSDTILEILNAIVLYFSNERIYMNVFIYEAYECSTSKSVVQECMLYK